ncbi:MAG TPA: pre-peptidase C-terminal domain-containing protein [Humisphaera sp.]|nr:pre-peptidase C-terminal domain-containing protein [Humisphaera sp.]
MPGLKSVVVRCERLEKRVLLNGVNEHIGELDGRAYRQGSVSGLNGDDGYHFTMAHPGSVDIQLSRPIGTGRVVFERGDDIPFTDFIANTPESNKDHQIHESGLAAGNYLVIVQPDTSQLFPQMFYTLEIATDYAPGALFTGSLDVHTNSARDLGTLSEESNNRVSDFVGYLDTSARVASDLIDTYSFTVPATGVLEVLLANLSLNDPAGSQAKVSADVTLYRDANNDGRLKSNEIIATSSTDGINIADLFRRPIDPGKYFVVASHLQPAVNDNTGGSNYTLDFIYGAHDSAGNTLANAKPVTLDASNKVFNDFLSSVDPTDVYKFTVGAGGPFIFDANMTGVANSDFDLQLVEDKNHNGNIDTGDIIASSQTRGVTGEHISRVLTVADSYFLIVNRFSGEDPYTLTMSNRNTDLAGNSRAAALDIGSLAGQELFSDALSAADTDDFFKFTTPAPGLLSAAFPATAAGTDANLQLLNSGGTVIAASVTAGNAGESVSATEPAGTYFVRVFRGAGSPTYNLALTLDTAGDTPATARVVSGNSTTGEFMDGTDLRDAFKIHVPAPEQLIITIAQTSAAMKISAGADANNNGVFDVSELKSVGGIAIPGGVLTLNVTAAQDLFIEAVSSGTPSNYQFKLATVPIDNAGNTLGGAAEIGTAGGAVVTHFSDFVGDGAGASDPIDFYHLGVVDGGPFVFVAQLTQLSALPANNAVFELIRDSNRNGIVDSGEIIASNAAPSAVKVLPATLTIPGDYYLEVARISGNVSDNLSLTIASTDTAGNTLATARNLGGLAASPSVNEFVGAIDSTDIYKVNVTQPGEIRVNIMNPTNGAVAADVIRDVNGNGTIDSGDVLATLSTGNVLDGVVLPAAGNYFVRVRPTAGDVSYSMALSFSTQTPFGSGPIQIGTAFAGTKIEAENFDKGGEGPAYHDTTPGNDNGAARANTNVDVKTTNDTGGGFRVTGTTVGEFLEYTINVAQSGNYDFDFRVSNNAAGGAFHVEIDGSNVTGTVAVPNTGGVDAMQTVTRTSIPLTAGPHMLRLAWDAAPSSGFCGAINFMTIRPSVTPGIFSISPATKTVKAGVAQNLALTWTVPSGSWHQLSDIRLRFLADNGAKFSLMWNEAAGTFSIYDPASGKYVTPMTVGGVGVLSNQYMTVNLSASSIHGAGPTVPTVTITFNIQLKSILAGHTIGLEAAADDDLGNQIGFLPGGIWNVTN